MGQNLVLDDGRVVVDKNFLDSHGRHLGGERKMYATSTRRDTGATSQRLSSKKQCRVCVSLNTLH